MDVTASGRTRLDVILFDADGTLFDFQRAERQALQQAMARFELDHEDERHPGLYTTINRDVSQQPSSRS